MKRFLRNWVLVMGVFAAVLVGGWAIIWLAITATRGLGIDPIWLVSVAAFLFATAAVAIPVTYEQRAERGD